MAENYGLVEYTNRGKSLKGELSGLLTKKYLKNIRDVLLRILTKKEQEQNVIGANNARKQYADMVKNIRSNPDTWHVRRIVT